MKRERLEENNENNWEMRSERSDEKSYEEKAKLK